MVQDVISSARHFNFSEDNDYFIVKRMKFDDYNNSDTFFNSYALRSAQLTK